MNDGLIKTLEKTLKFLFENFELVTVQLSIFSAFIKTNSIKKRQNCSYLQLQNLNEIAIEYEFLHGYYHNFKVVVII